MIAFVKTYEIEFRKMKDKMNILENENKNLKRKLGVTQNNRRLSAANVEYAKNEKLAGCLLIEKAAKNIK